MELGARSDSDVVESRDGGGGDGDGDCRLAAAAAAAAATAEAAGVTTADEAAAASVEASEAELVGSVSVTLPCRVVVVSGAFLLVATICSHCLLGTSW